MAQFCPRCGTQDPDDGALFCKRCGTPLPPPVPVPRVTACPRCGTPIADRHAVFCDKCGSALPQAPPAPVQHVVIRPAAARAVPKVLCPSCGAPRVDDTSDFCNVCGASFSHPVPRGPAGTAPAAARPAVPKVLCPSCGAPRVDDTSDFCNVCGSAFRPAGPPVTASQPEPSAPVRKEPVSPRPSRLPAGPHAPAAGPGQGRPDEESDPVRKTGRRPLLKRALAAGIILVLVVLAVVLPGMHPGAGPSENTTPVPTIAKTTTLPPAPAATETTVPEPTPEKTTLPPAAPVNVTTTVPANASVTVRANATANATATINPNASVVTTTLAITNGSQPLAVGESAYDGKGRLTLNSFSFKDKLSDPTPSYAIGKKYLIVGITYENLQKNLTMETVPLNSLAVVDGGGYTYDQVTDGAVENPWPGYAAIPPGQNQTGNKVFIVPPEATFLKLQYRFGDQTTVTFTLT